MRAKVNKIMIAVPCFEKLDTAFVMCMEKLKRVGEVTVCYLPGSLVYAAREDLARKAVKDGFDYVLWLDSDMIFDSELLENLLLVNKDIVCGLFFRRKAPFTPVIYKKLRVGMIPSESEIEEYLEYPEDSIFEVESCGFGAVLMKTKVIADVLENCGVAFMPIPGYGEDISFCIRARKNGYQIYCDSSVKVGHLAQTVVDEASYERFRNKN